MFLTTKLKTLSSQTVVSLIQTYRVRFLYLLGLTLTISALSGCIALLTPTVEVDIAKLRAGQYSLDKKHASLLFKVPHMGLSSYIGRFNDFDASLDFDPDDIANAKLDAIIEIISLDINNPGLEEDLMDGTWFDQPRYPQAKFSTLSVTPLTDSEFEFVGNLDWRGIVQPISLVVTFHGGANNMLTGYYTIGFSAKGSFSRSDFGMDAYIPMVGDLVEIETYAEFQKR